MFFFLSDLFDFPRSNSKYISRTVVHRVDFLHGTEKGGLTISWLLRELGTES
jgi:hypothetical protein